MTTTTTMTKTMNLIAIILILIAAIILSILGLNVIVETFNTRCTFDAKKYFWNQTNQNLCLYSLCISFYYLIFILAAILAAIMSPLIGFGIIIAYFMQLCVGCMLLCGALFVQMSYEQDYTTNAISPV